MSEIIHEYYKLYKFSTIFVWVWAAVISVGLYLSARGNENLRLFDMIVSGIAVIYALVITIITLTAPKAFKSRLKKLPENERGELKSKGFTKIGKRWFYENYALFISARKIRFVKFSEIKSLEPKGGKIRLILQNGKKVFLPIEPEENSAMLAAALKAKNPEIAVIINGKVVEKTEKSEEKEETK